MSDAAAAPAVSAAKPKAAAVKAGSFKEAGFCRNTWCATVDQGTSFDDLVRPDFWLQCITQIRPSDHIEVYFADGSAYAEMLVISTNRSGARTVFISKLDLNANVLAPSMADLLVDYKVTWAGPAHKWRVTKIGVVEPIKTGFPTESDANTWLVGEYLTGIDKDGKKIAA